MDEGVQMEYDECDYSNIIGDTTWLEIMEYLDGSSLLRMTSVCHKFKELIGRSKTLMKKLKFSMNFPEDPAEELKNIKKGLETCMNCLTKNYLNLKIKNLRDRILRRDMRSTYISIISKLSETVINLEINTCYLARDDVFIVLHSFEHLVELKLNNLAFSDDLMPSEIVQLKLQADQKLNCPNLKILRLIQCDFYCLLLLKSHDKLEILEISLASYERPDVEKLEDFLLKQSNLKDFKLTHFRFNSTYSTDRLAHVPFQLEKLCFKEVSWDLKNHCTEFIKTQKKLKTFELKRFRSWISPKETNYIWFCDIIKHIWINNRLEKLIIDTSQSSVYFNDSDFLIDACNSNVKELTYIFDFTDKSQLFKIFTRIFPNVEVFNFIDCPQGRYEPMNIVESLHLFKNLKELNITSVPACLANFSLACVENLTSFYFHATNEDKSLERLKHIFAGQSKIESFGICIEPLTIEEVLELIMSFAGSLRKLSIDDLHLNVTEAELLIRNFPNLKYLTSDVNLTADVISILKEKNVNFAKCNRLRIN